MSKDSGFTPNSEVDRANEKVADYSSSLGFRAHDIKIAVHPRTHGATHFYVEFTSRGRIVETIVPLTVAVLVPSGKLYFPITNEVHDLKEKSKDKDRAELSPEHDHAGQY